MDDKEMFKPLDNLGGDSVRVLKGGVTAKLNGVVFQNAPDQGSAAVGGEAVAENEPTELEAALAENDRLRDALADKINGETLLTELNINQGGLNMQFEGGACHMLAEQFAQQFREMGGDNYIEMGFTARSDGMPLLVTIQRVSGKTPATLKTEAEAKLATAKNFHRSLCDRFGYSHDDQDWLRDLVSLEEFIARKVSARAADAPSNLRQALIDVRHAIQFSHDSLNGIDKMPVMMHQRGTVVEFIDGVLSAKVGQLADSTGGVKS